MYFIHNKIFLLFVFPFKIVSLSLCYLTCFVFLWEFYKKDGISLVIAFKLLALYYNNKL